MFYYQKKKILPMSLIKFLKTLYPANIYLFKVNSSNTRKKCEFCSKLTIKTPEPRQWRSIYDTEQVNVSREGEDIGMCWTCWGSIIITLERGQTPFSDVYY